MSDEREIEIVVGTVGAIIQKGEDKWQVEVMPAGSQYAKKLWTKSPDTHALAVTLIGQTATFECGVSHWAKQDGTPVKSLWINAINPGAPPPSNPVQTTATPTPPPAGPQQAPQRLADPTRDSIEKQVALKCAVERHAGESVPALLVCDTAQVFFDWLQGRAAAPTTEDPPTPSDIDDLPF